MPQKRTINLELKGDPWLEKVSKAVDFFKKRS